MRNKEKGETRGWGSEEENYMIVRDIYYQGEKMKKQEEQINEINLEEIFGKKLSIYKYITNHN